MSRTLKTIIIERKKARNHVAALARRLHVKGGRHRDRRKEASRKACRKGGWDG